MAISTSRSTSQAFAASIWSWTRDCSSMTLFISASGRSSPSFMDSSSKRVTRAFLPATASSTCCCTFFFGSSWGSCGRWPMRVPSAGKASPAKSLSIPAMMRRSVVLPAPLWPRTPILASR